MSEYSEQHSVARLTGSPPGYVGYEEGGYLTEAVRRKPYTVVLFDEVEKAHPRVLTVLLQLLDEGRLTDSHGRTVDFTNTVIILTSNIGAEYLLDVNEDDQAAVDTAHIEVMKKVRSHFAPEFLNRLSAICMFNALGPKQLEEIVYKSMRGVQRRLATQGVRIVLESSGARAILMESYDPNYGARPVERYMESTIVTELSKMLISGELVANKTVHIEAVDVDDISIDERDMPYKKLKPSLVYRVEDTTLADDMAEVDELNAVAAMEE